MLPAVALVGRPNVGKSTLFNQLTGSRDALVADYPGLTRDRRYGFGNFEGRSFIAIDTGGLGDDAGEVDSLAARQAQIAMDEADAVVLVVDYREGLTAADQHIAERLRSSNKPVTIAVNKSEGLGPELAEAEFHSLGLGSPVSIAALHGRRIASLMREVLDPFAPEPSREEEERDRLDGPRLAVESNSSRSQSHAVPRDRGSRVGTAHRRVCLGLAAVRIGRGSRHVG